MHSVSVLLPHAVPAALGGLLHVPALQTSSVHELPSEQSAALAQPPTVNVTDQEEPVEKFAAMKKEYVPGPTGTPPKEPLLVRTCELLNVAEPLKPPPEIVQLTATTLLAAGTVTWK